MNARPRRSALYLPASNAKAIAKARTLSCDVVILDLEDAVAPDAKALARDLAVAAIKEGGFGARELVVRVNALDTEWGADDLAALYACAPDAVLVPKIMQVGDVDSYASHLAAQTPIWAMIETAASLFRLDAIAGADQIAALVMGTNRSGEGNRGAAGTRQATVCWRTRLSCCRCADAWPRQSSTVCTTISTTHVGFNEQARQAVEFGFDGKTLISPAPDRAVQCSLSARSGGGVLAWARLIVGAFDLPERL